MKRLGFTTAVAILFALSALSGDSAFAQSTAEQQNELKAQIERRFDVVPLRGRVLLKPKDERGYRSIDLTDAAIAIDGAVATGPELRDKLGDDADLVLRLSYLEPEARRRLFQPTVEAPPGVPPPPPLPVERDRRFGRRERDGGDRFRFGGNVVVRADEVVDGDVVALGGSVTVDGRVRGDVVAIGGSLQLGPSADVSGDAVTIGGTLTRDPGARVGGKVVDVGAGNFDFSRMRWDRFPFGRALTFAPFFGAAAGLIAFMSTLARVVVLCVLTSLVLLVGRGYVEQVGARAIAEPVKAGAIGLLAQLLFIPLLFVTVLLLIVTIIGIPLLVLVPFAILALAVVGLVGFTAITYNLGRFASERLSWNIENPYLIAVTGIVVLLSPVLIARLLGLAEWMLFPITGALAFCGFLLEYLAWTVGFGAVALLRFARPGPGSTPASTPAPAV
jgi:hypothetical protein